MVHSDRRIAATAFAAVATLALSAAANAAIAITYAQVTHDIRSQQGSGGPVSGGPVSVLDSNSTGNAFSTYDAANHVGFVSTIGATGGYFRASDSGGFNGSGGKDTASTLGTVDFTVTGGTFSITGSSGDAPYGPASGSMSIKNLSTLETWILGYYTIGDASVQGNFPAVAPAGSYELTWAVYPYTNLGYHGESSLQANLSFVPEPTTLGAIAGGALILMRRKR